MNEKIKNKLQCGLALTVKESWDLYKYIEALEQELVFDKLDEIITKQIDISNNQVECQTLRWVLDVMNEMDVETLQEQKIGHCKACKWWKDSDGMFRRGIDAESKCPINRKEVYEGSGYCFMFEPCESEG